jgi:hypothetical protein
MNSDTDNLWSAAARRLWTFGGDGTDVSRQQHSTAWLDASNAALQKLQ